MLFHSNILEMET